MASLQSLPVEVLVDNLFTQCDLRDLLSLARTNKLFAVLCADDTFWRRKCEQDFNFTGAGTARTSGWKFLYKGLHRPRIFVWGENRNGRLGLASRVDRRAIPQPTEIKIPKTRIVSLVAGGMSFHALDSVGSMYVWGTLDGQGQMALHSEGFSIPYKAATTPHKLLMPEPIRSISCGRLHTMALDSASQVWTFLSWGRPFRLQSPLLDSYAPDTTPQQIECGWAFSSILTKSGDVLVYWPFNGDMQREIEEREAQMNEMGDKNAYATSDKCISCAPWILQKDPFRLLVIPALPDLPDTGLSEEQLAEETKLIKIAAYDCHIVGLTNKGHVLKFGDLSSEVSYTRGHWEYLPQFSEAARVAEHPTFSDPDSTIEAPKAMHITHISAHFETFVAYSTGRSSVILMGSTATNADTPPKVLPALQHRDIISVVLGDYHFGALTATGKLFTWGSYSQGARATHMCEFPHRTYAGIFGAPEIYHVQYIRCHTVPVDIG
ncbi:hypothetical protein EWM64_g5186 [Hericium alpestre]|uniref:F-box domain-containing protein n=1 Tax=Hericium alpestre TaxID=135208 RepID=A0A4Y9ZXM8_9AGAM|nr:hypothetical protein EWM64_g5186 [Hericium alpestre]